MEEVKIRSGTRIKLKRIQDEVLPPDFILKLREFAHKDERIQAVFIFAIQAEEDVEHPSMALAVKAGLFGSRDEIFLRLVDEIQMMLPEGLSLNLYRFGASEQLSRYLANNVEPVYLRSTGWLEKQRKKLS